MKKFAIAAALGALTVSMPAFAAGDVTGNVTVNGTVASKCQFTTNSATITIPELAGTDGKLLASTVNGQTATLVGWCNKSASTIAVNATSLSNTSVATAAAGFARVVDFAATAKAYNGTTLVGTASDANSADATAGAAGNVTMFRGDITVELSAAATAADTLLTAGSYQGNVAVTLTPAT